MKKSKKGLAIFIVVFGVILVAAAAFIAIRSSVYKKNGIETVATITRIEHETDSDGDDNASVYVSYTANGENYEGKLDYYSSFMRVGNTVKIFYMPDDPQDMISAGSNVVLVTIMIAFGIICIGLGTTCVAVPAAKKRRLNRLKKNGRKVNARVKEFDCSGKTRVMGKILLVSFAWIPTETATKRDSFTTVNGISISKPRLRYTSIRTIPKSTRSTSTDEFIIRQNARTGTKKPLRAFILFVFTERRIYRLRSRRQVRIPS